MARSFVDLLQNRRIKLREQVVKRVERAGMFDVEVVVVLSDTMPTRTWHEPKQTRCRLDGRIFETIRTSHNVEKFPGSGSIGISCTK